MDNTQSEPPVKTVVFIEDFSLDSIEDKIVALGHTFQKRSLGLQPHNWLEIENDIERLKSSEELLAVLFFLSKDTLLELSDLEHWHHLLSCLQDNNSLIFVPEDCLSEKIVLDAFDDVINEGIVFISNHVLHFRSYISADIKALGKFSIKIDGSYCTMHSEKAQSFKIHMLSLKRTNPLTFDLLRKMQNLLQWVHSITLCLQVQDISKSVKLDKKELPDILEEAKGVELLLEQLQKDFAEKQTKQSQEAHQLLQMMQVSGIEIVPYRQRKEISLRVHHFLDEVDKGIFLHLYVPNGQYQEDQLASFLRLLENYLQRVEQLPFSIDARRTLHGIVYEFTSKKIVLNLSDVEIASSRFESFINLCQNDQKKAERLLLDKGITPSEASRLMTKYVKEYQRLMLDIDHEKERKMLDIRHRLESEVLDLADGSSLPALQTVQPSALLALSTNVDPVHIIIANSSVSFNSGIQSFAEQAIYGDIHYSVEDKQLFAMFEKFAEQAEIVRLKAELQQLKDTSSPEPERKTAKQKIVGFLYKVAPAIGQSALTVLTAYLEKILIGS